MKFSPYFAFMARDYEKALDFYQNVMGMKVEKKGEQESQLTLGDVNFCVVNEENFKATYFEFEVDDLEKAKDEFVAAGCEIQESETDEGNKSYNIFDPYGMNFHIFQSPGVGS